ncbi:MAG: hypothetical protein Q8916_01080 [Bacteroidota bacterium]|nr:hypothetical protein [Bacteroidota bacterium]MDP4228979.1 hypothetical protein [Bacteroidota bacterium]
MKYLVFLLGFSILYAGCSSPTTPLPVLSDKFSDIQTQTFNKSCAKGGCHDANSQQALLCLTTDSCYSQLMHHQIQAIGKKYRALVVPGFPDSSFLVYKLTTNQTTIDYGEAMPQRLNHLPQNQIDAIISWIKRGAPND